MSGADENKRTVVIRCGHCNNVIAVIEANKYTRYHNPLKGITKCPHCGAQLNLVIKSVRVMR